MKNLVKKSILAILAIVITITCVPTTAQAKDQYKWTKSAVLKGKQYKVASDETSEYEVCLWSDREAELTVKTYNGAVTAYCKTYKDTWDAVCPTGNLKNVKKAHHNEQTGFHSELSVNTKYRKQNKVYKIPVRRGFNAICIRACKDANVKIGQTYKCKITATDANIVVLSSKRNIYGNTIKNTFISESTFKSFVKWVGPQDASLCDWMRADGTCEYLAYHLILAGLTDYTDGVTEIKERAHIASQKDNEFAKEIIKEIDAKVEKSKYSGGKILSYQEVFEEYVNSYEGFEEAIKAINAVSNYYDDWEEIQSELWISKNA